MSPAAKLVNIQTFCLAFELGSFTAAAKSLGVTPQAASRSVARLEAVLGVQLFRRNTRQVRPTDAGQRYYASCKSALTLLASAEEALAKEKQDTPTGRVRISVPTTYGHCKLLPALANFRRRYPLISIDVEVSSENIDFVRHGFDLAVRMGRLADTSLIARRLGNFSLGVFASPDYLNRNGIPKTPTDLRAHECIVFLRPSTGKPIPWEFSPKPRQLVPPAQVQISGDALGLISMALGGGGLIQIYYFIIEDELRRGELVEVLTPFTGRRRIFSLLYPKSSVQRPAVRALADFIVADARPDRGHPPGGSR